MKKNNEMISLIYIVIGSLLVLGLLIINHASYVEAITELGTLPQIFKLISFLTITTTILAIVHVEYKNRSKWWYFPIFVFSSLGNLFFAIYQIYYAIRYEKDEGNVKSREY